MISWRVASVAWNIKRALCQRCAVLRHGLSTVPRWCIRWAGRETGPQRSCCGLWHGLTTVPRWCAARRVVARSPDRATVVHHDSPTDLPPNVGRSGDLPTTMRWETCPQRCVGRPAHNGPEHYASGACDVRWSSRCLTHCTHSLAGGP